MSDGNKGEQSLLKKKEQKKVYRPKKGGSAVADTEVVHIPMSDAEQLA